MSRKPGDWNCRSCQYLNFCKRESCQRCGDPKFGIERTDYTSISGGGWEVKPGDWYCSCGVHNYASRANCFKCGATKNDNSTVTHSWGFGLNAHQTGWKSGDWICARLGCNEHNYAIRTECFRCSAPRHYGN
ncbi:RNA-binding protein involved in heterochromatin assembly dri1-like [Typha angustifolia]|uniref:RNA-binding protein involved in heterochromatin assembly dri1-like n=1 Tax=Typha angustifolia TaxID=59011 RepID=UPI003C2DC8BE